MSPDPITEATRRVGNFADEMRRQNIHVGVGRNPVCVTCGETWPCAASEDNPR